MKLTERALEMLDKISELRAKVDKMEHELRRALLLQLVWPDVFEYGAIKTHVTGKPITRMAFTVSFSNVKEPDRTVDLLEVPVLLWNAQVRTELQQRKNHNTKYARKLREAERGVG